MNNLIKVFSTSDDIEMQLIINMLSENNIQCIKKDNGSGEYIRMYMESSLFGKDIFVDENDHKEAVELINEYKQNHTLDQKNEDNTIKNRKRIYGIIVLFIVFGIPILTIFAFIIFKILFVL